MATPGSAVVITTNAKPQWKVFAQRWTGFVTAIWLMALSGTYGFPNYSTALKEVLGLNQKQLNRLSVAKDLGDSCGIIAGILCNYVPAQSLLCIAACVNLIGNGIQWLVISHRISAPPYWAMFMVATLAGNTTSWLNTAVFTLSVRNFPRNRGPVAGLYKAYMGLSAAVYSSFCDIFFASSSSMFLLMLTVVPSTICLITAIFLRPVTPSETPQDTKAEQHNLHAFTIISICVAVLLCVQNLVPDVTKGTPRLVFIVLLFFFLAAPAFVPLVCFLKLNRESSTLGPSSHSEEDDNVVIDTTKDSSDVGATTEPNTEGDALSKVVWTRSDKDLMDTSGGGDTDGLRRPLLDQCNDVADKPMQGSSGLISSAIIRLGEDRPTLLMFKAWHMYVLYMSLFCAAGSGMAFSNNLGQVGQSFGFSSVTIFNSLFSLGNFFGRIASGNVSEYFLKARSTPRPVWLGVAKVPMIASFAWLSMGSAVSLYTGSFVLGLSHGVVVSLTIPTISEFYGLKYFGLNYMVISTHILAGSMVFSGVIAGYLYDMHATAYEGDGGTTLICYGVSCYGTTFCVFAGFLALGLFCDGLLAHISRPLYKHLQDINKSVIQEQQPRIKSGVQVIRN